jgi:superfamily II DNA/RNA helicase
MKYPAPAKIIIYSSRKQQADTLGAELGCMVYHADVGSRKEKDKRLAKWMQGNEDHRVVVATNALGLGIDIGDTRVVGHIGMPKDLANYVQESGRAGRDGAPSESVVLLPADTPRDEPGRKRYCIVVGGVAEQRPVAGEATGYRHKAVTSDEREMAAEVEDFIRARCRRVVLDRVMDGRYDRLQCEEGEEVCDMCQESQRQVQLQQARERMLSRLDQDSDGPSDPGQDDIEFEQQQSQRSWIDFHAREVNQEEAYAVEELEQQLQRFQQQCTWCFVHGRMDSRGHRLADCRTDYAGQVREYCKGFITAVRDKKTMEAYSCCLFCYVPQAICQRWKAKGEHGRWERDPTKDCQFKGVIVEGFWSMMFVQGQEGFMEGLKEWGQGDGYDIDDDEGRLRWLGKKVEWGGIEANKLVQAFLFMAREVKEGEDFKV